MRPVRKKAVGEIIEVSADIADMPTKRHKIKEEYRPYGKAREVLLANIGEYCSYCETYCFNGATLQTEHVQPKGYKENNILKYANLTYKWSNFLLGCSTCNGAGNKGEKDVVLGEVHLPHLNNTFLSLTYLEAGVVKVNPNLPEESKLHAEKLIELVGLNKPSSETDYRCDMRRRAWDKAQINLRQYENGEIDLDKLIAYIKEQPCWSIWFTVFSAHDEVKEALLEFPGTAKECFDAGNHYNPIYRNVGSADPV